MVDEMEPNDNFFDDNIFDEDLEFGDEEEIIIDEQEVEIELATPDDSAKTDSAKTDSADSIKDDDDYGEYEDYEEIIQVIDGDAIILNDTQEIARDISNMLLPSYREKSDMRSFDIKVEDYITMLNEMMDENVMHIDEAADHVFNNAIIKPIVHLQKFISPPDQDEKDVLIMEYDGESAIIVDLGTLLNNRAKLTKTAKANHVYNADMYKCVAPFYQDTNHKVVVANDKDALFQKTNGDFEEVRLLGYNEIQESFKGDQVKVTGLVSTLSDVKDVTDVIDLDEYVAMLQNMAKGDRVRIVPHTYNVSSQITDIKHVVNDRIHLVNGFAYNITKPFGHGYLLFPERYKTPFSLCDIWNGAKYANVKNVNIIDIAQPNPAAYAFTLDNSGVLAKFLDVDDMYYEFPMIANASGIAKNVKSMITKNVKSYVNANIKKIKRTKAKQPKRKKQRVTFNELTRHLLQNHKDQFTSTQKINIQTIIKELNENKNAKVSHVKFPPDNAIVYNSFDAACAQVPNKDDQIAYVRWKSHHVLITSANGQWHVDIAKQSKLHGDLKFDPLTLKYINTVENDAVVKQLSVRQQIQNLKDIEVAKKTKFAKKESPNKEFTFVHIPKPLKHSQVHQRHFQGDESYIDFGDMFENNDGINHHAMMDVVIEEEDDESIRDQIKNALSIGTFVRYTIKLMDAHLNEREIDFIIQHLEVEFDISIHNARINEKMTEFIKRAEEFVKSHTAKGKPSKEALAQLKKMKLTKAKEAEEELLKLTKNDSKGIVLHFFALFIIIAQLHFPNPIVNISMPGNQGRFNIFTGYPLNDKTQNTFIDYIAKMIVEFGTTGANARYSFARKKTKQDIAGLLEITIKEILASKELLRFQLDASRIKASKIVKHEVKAPKAWGSFRPFTSKSKLDVDANTNDSTQLASLYIKQLNAAVSTDAKKMHGLLRKVTQDAMMLIPDAIPILKKLHKASRVKPSQKPKLVFIANKDKVKQISYINHGFLANQIIVDEPKLVYQNEHKYEEYIHVVQLNKFRAFNEDIFDTSLEQLAGDMQNPQEWNTFSKQNRQLFEQIQLMPRINLEALQSISGKCLSVPDMTLIKSTRDILYAFIAFDMSTILGRIVNEYKLNELNVNKRTYMQITKRSKLLDILLDDIKHYQKDIRIDGENISSISNVSLLYFPETDYAIIHRNVILLTYVLFKKIMSLDIIVINHLITMLSDNLQVGDVNLDDNQHEFEVQRESNKQKLMDKTKGMPEDIKHIYNEFKSRNMQHLIKHDMEDIVDGNEDIEGDAYDAGIEIGNVDDMIMDEDADEDVYNGE